VIEKKKMTEEIQWHIRKQLLKNLKSAFFYNTLTT